MMILTGRTISSGLRPPYPYGGEFVSQFLFALRLCWLPLLLSTVAISYGAPGLRGGELPYDLRRDSTGSAGSSWSWRSAKSAR